MQLIDQMLNSNANAYPDNDALIVENTTLTYRELIKNVNKLANGLRKTLGRLTFGATRPHGSTGKILKRELRAKLRNGRPGSKLE